MSLNRAFRRSRLDGHPRGYPLTIAFLPLEHGRNSGAAPRRLSTVDRKR
jgi:hypothetical protein